MPQVVFGVPNLHGLDILGPIIPVDKVLQAIKAVQDKYVDEGIRRGRQYPPKTAGQRYKRTGRIASSWHRQRSTLTSEGVEARIWNTATQPAKKGVRKTARPYASYVFGEAALGYDQAEVHKGRWPTEEELIDRRAYERDVYLAIARAIGG